VANDPKAFTVHSPAASLMSLPKLNKICITLRGPSPWRRAQQLLARRTLRTR
jgi:hypothetical protein